MTLQVPVKRRRMPGGRFLTAVGLVFLLQVGLMFWLSAGTENVTDTLPNVPVMTLADPGLMTDFVFEDPTLFVLPRRESFSGPVWMSVEERTFELRSWTEPPRLLEVSPGDLGTAFVQYVRNDAMPEPERTPLYEPPLILPPAIPTLPIALQSGLRVDGELAQRRLLAMPELPPMPGTDLLTNSIVQVTVDARGQVFSAVLRDRAGTPDNPHQALADSNALHIAQQLRFGTGAEPRAENRAEPAAELTVGTLVFQWETAPATTTDATQGP